MKKACKQCPERQFYARRFDMHFSGADCWYECQYADDDPKNDIREDNTDDKPHNVPTIDADPVRYGKWKQGKDMKPYKNKHYQKEIFYCDNCGNEAYWDTDYGQQLFSYCPYCGTKMKPM